MKEEEDVSAIVAADDLGHFGLASSDLAEQTHSVSRCMSDVWTQFGPEEGRKLGTEYKRGIGCVILQSITPLDDSSRDL